MSVIKSPLRWLGGKFLLAKKIVPLFPPHACYCEVFGGAGHVLFRKEESGSEVLNDIDGELVNFWRQLQTHGQELIQRAETCLYSRQVFNEYAGMSREQAAALDNAERAWRFYYINRACFGGRMKRPSFGYWLNSKANMPPTWPQRLAMASQRMRRVLVEQLPWQKCLRLYDGPGTLFYLDPPYLGYENDYGKGKFCRRDFYDLAAGLAGIQGKFVLSINDCPEAREIFKGFALLLDTEVRYSVNRDRNLHKGELVFANFDLAREAAA